MPTSGPSWSKAISRTLIGVWRINIRELSRCLRENLPINHAERLLLSEAFDTKALVLGTLKPARTKEDDERLICKLYLQAYELAADPRQPPRSRETTRSKRALEITYFALERDYGLVISIPVIRNRLRDGRHKGYA